MAASQSALGVTPSGLACGSIAAASASVAASAPMWSEPMAMLGEFSHLTGPSVIFTFECLGDGLRSATAAIGGKRAPAMMPPSEAVRSIYASASVAVDGARGHHQHHRGRAGSSNQRSRRNSAMVVVGGGERGVSPLSSYVTPSSLGLQASSSLLANRAGGGGGASSTLPQTHTDGTYRVASMPSSSTGGGGYQQQHQRSSGVSRMVSPGTFVASGGGGAEAAGAGGVVVTNPFTTADGARSVAAAVVTPAAAAMISELSSHADFHSRTLTRPLMFVSPHNTCGPTASLLPRASGVLDWVPSAQTVASSVTVSSSSCGWNNTTANNALTQTQQGQLQQLQQRLSGGGVAVATANGPTVGGEFTRTQLVCSDMLFGKHIVSGSNLRKKDADFLLGVVQRTTNGGCADTISIFTDPVIGGVASLSFNLFDVEARGEKRPMQLIITHPDPRELVSRMSILGPYLTAIVVDIVAKSDEIRQVENANGGAKSSEQKKRESNQRELRVTGFAGLLRTLHRELHDFFDIVLPSTLSSESMGVFNSLMVRSKQQQEKRESKRLAIHTAISAAAAAAANTAAGAGGDGGDNLTAATTAGQGPASSAAAVRSGDYYAPLAGTSRAIGASSLTAASAIANSLVAGGGYGSGGSAAAASIMALSGGGATVDANSFRNLSDKASYVNDAEVFDVMDPRPASQRTIAERSIATIIKPPFITRTDPQVFRTCPVAFIDMSGVAAPEVAAPSSSSGGPTTASAAGGGGASGEGAAAAADGNPTAAATTTNTAGNGGGGGTDSDVLNAILNNKTANGDGRTTNTNTNTGASKNGGGAIVVEDAPIPRPPLEDQDIFIETIQSEMDMLPDATAVTFQLVAPQRFSSSSSHHHNRHHHHHSHSHTQHSSNGGGAAGVSNGSISCGLDESPVHSHTHDSGVGASSSRYHSHNDMHASNHQHSHGHYHHHHHHMDPLSPSLCSTRRGSLASIAAPLLPPQNVLPVASDPLLTVGDGGVGVVVPLAAAGGSISTPISDTAGPLGGAVNSSNQQQQQSLLTPFRSTHLHTPEESRALYHRFPCANQPPPKPLSANPRDYTPMHLLHREQRTRCVVVEVEAPAPRSEGHHHQQQRQSSSNSTPPPPFPPAAEGGDDGSGVAGSEGGSPSPSSPSPPQQPAATNNTAISSSTAVVAATAAQPVRIPHPNHCAIIRNRMREMRIVPTVGVRPVSAWLLDAFWLLRDNLYVFRTSFAPIITAVLSGGKVIIAGERGDGGGCGEAGAAADGGAVAVGNAAASSSHLPSSTAGSSDRGGQHASSNGPSISDYSDYADGELAQCEETAASFALSLANLLPQHLQKTQLYCNAEDEIEGSSAKVQSLGAEFLRQNIIVQTSILSSKKQFVLSQLKPDGIVFVTVKPGHDVEYWSEDEEEDDAAEADGGGDRRTRRKARAPMIRFPPCIGNVTNVDELYYKENPQETYSKKALNDLAFATAWRHHAAATRDCYPQPSTTAAAGRNGGTNPLAATVGGGGMPAIANTTHARSQTVGGGGPSAMLNNPIADFVANSEWRARAPPPSSFPFNSTKYGDTKEGRPSWQLRNSLEVMEAYGRKVYPTVVVDMIERTIQLGTLLEQSIKGRQRRIYTAIQAEKAAKRRKQQQQMQPPPTAAAAAGGSGRAAPPANEAYAGLNNDTSANVLRYDHENEIEESYPRTNRGGGVAAVPRNNNTNNSASHDAHQDGDDDQSGILTLEEDIQFVQLAGITDLSSVIDSTTEQCRRATTNAAAAAGGGANGGGGGGYSSPPRGGFPFNANSGSAAVVGSSGNSGGGVPDVNTSRAYYDQHVMALRAKRAAEAHAAKAAARAREEREKAVAAAAAAVAVAANGKATVAARRTRGGNANQQQQSAAAADASAAAATATLSTTAAAADLLLSPQSTPSAAGGGGVPPPPSTTTAAAAGAVSPSQFAPNEVYLLQLALESSVREGVSRGRLYIDIYSNIQYDIISNLERGVIGVVGGGGDLGGAAGAGGGPSNGAMSGGGVKSSGASHRQPHGGASGRGRHHPDGMGGGGGGGVMDGGGMSESSRRHHSHHARTTSTFGGGYPANNVNSSSGGGVPMMMASSSADYYGAASSADSGGAADALSALLPDGVVGAAGGREGAMALAAAGGGGGAVGGGIVHYRNVSLVDAARVAEAFSNTGSILNSTNRGSVLVMPSVGGGGGAGGGGGKGRSGGGGGGGGFSLLSKLPAGLRSLFRDDASSAASNAAAAAQLQQSTAANSKRANGGDAEGGKKGGEGAGGGRKGGAGGAAAGAGGGGGDGADQQQQRGNGEGFEFIRREIQSNPRLRTLMKKWRYGIADDEVLCFLGSAPSPFF